MSTRVLPIFRPSYAGGPKGSGSKWRKYRFWPYWFVEGYKGLLFEGQKRIGPYWICKHFHPSSAEAMACARRKLLLIKGLDKDTQLA